jgi:predicted metal-dependent HD superfamily phosphohydrolase
MSDDLTDLLQQVLVTDVAKQAVVDRLQEPHRKYHNLAHIEEMWRWHHRYGQGKFTQHDEQIIASFCLYHDAIYDPMVIGDRNEQASCDLWLADSRDIVSQPVRIAVDDIIFASADHFHIRTMNENAILNWCLDLDLLRLGSDEFIEHGRNIRLEYGHVTDLQWTKASSEFRAKAMAQSAIFVHTEFAAFEQQARRNLSQALLQDWQLLGYLR